MMNLRLGHFGAAMALVGALATQPGALAQGLNTGQGAAGGGVGGRGMGGAGGDELPGSVDALRYDPVAEYKRGLADLQAGRFARADNEFGHSLMTDPANADTLYMRGKAKTGEGDLKGAEKFYDKALRVDSLKIPALRDSALTLTKLGQADKAQARLAVLKASNDACGGTCSQASELKDAVTVVQAALGPAPGAANFADRVPKGGNRFPEQNARPKPVPAELRSDSIRSQHALDVTRRAGHQEATADRLPR